MPLNVFNTVVLILGLKVGNPLNGVSDAAIDNEIICNIGDFELEHCIYDHTNAKWVYTYSAPQPTLGLYTTLYPCGCTMAVGYG